MRYFKHLREEVQERKDPKSKTLHAFDMDEVLFHHDHSKLKVHVKDQQGKRVQSLTNTEYNDHKLKHGHSYDYSDFKSHKVFQKSAHPIHKMINKLKAIHKNNKKNPQNLMMKKMLAMKVKSKKIFIECLYINFK